MWQHLRLTKTARLERLLLDEIESRGLKPHDKFMTEAEIVEKFGINQTTVRQTLARLSAEGVIYRVSGKGTFVSPPSRTTPIIVVARQADRPNAFSRFGLSDFMESLHLGEKSAQYGCYPILISGDEYLAHAKEIQFIYRNLGGIIFFSDPSSYLQTEHILAESGIPALYYGSDLNLPPDSTVNALLYPQHKLIDIAMSHLVAQGYTRIGAATAAGRPHRAQRVDLYREWMTQHLPQWKDLVVIDVEEGLGTPEGRIELERRLREATLERGINAWFCVDDPVGNQLMNAAYRVDFKVPEDMAMVSISNYLICDKMVCPLTSVEVPFAADAGRCLEVLSKLHRASGVYRDWSEIRLIERRSSAPPSARSEARGRPA